MDASNARAKAADTANREIVITRTFDAPRDLVFKAWTDPKRIGYWWGPRGFTITIFEMDVRPSGVWRFLMHGPDGTDYPNRNVFVEIKRPELLVYEHGEEGAPASFRTTVTFEDEAGKTRLTLRMVFPTAAERDEIERRHHAIEGGNQTLDRLGEHVAKIISGAAAEELFLTRIFDAPCETVFAAWTEPERLRRWWGPKNFTNPVCEVDVRPGGAIRIDMRAPDGTVYPMGGTFHEITPPDRLVFTSIALDASGQPQLEVLNTVTFENYRGRTRLTLTAKVVRATAIGQTYQAGMEEGWSQSIEKLAGEVESG